MAMRECGWTLCKLVLAEPGHEPLPVAPAMGAVVVEVPQIQFFDDEVVVHVQFLDKFIVGPVYATTVVVARWGAVH